MAIILKTKAEIAIMREAGRIVAGTHEALRQAIKPGVPTSELDRIAYEYCSERGARPAFKGYRGFPASLCVSINEEIVHGIPSRKRILREGDIVSLDFGVVYQGFYGDAAKTVPVGDVSDEAANLLKVTEEALYKGIEQAAPGRRLHDISAAVQAHAEVNGYSVVRQYVGHGIGRNMHEAPHVPNFGKPGTGPLLKTGMVLAIEPMVNVGTYETLEKGDKWTVVTKDSSLSAHFEHTVAITADGHEILTLP